MTTNKKSNNIIAFFVFYLLAANFSTFAMDSAPQELKKKKPNKVRRAVRRVNTWLDAVENIVLGNAPVTLLSTPPQQIDPFAFTSLPKDIQQTIITLLVMGANAQSLQEAAASINSLAQVNHELNDLINNPTFCLQIIKHLAQRFNCFDENACRALQTSESRRRLNIQGQLSEMCYSPCIGYAKDNMDEFRKIFISLLNQGVDITFIYHFFNAPVTALEMAKKSRNAAMVKILTDALKQQT